jgi:phage FluMu protein Com
MNRWLRRDVNNFDPYIRARLACPACLNLSQIKHLPEDTEIKCPECSTVIALEDIYD